MHPIMMQSGWRHMLAVLTIVVLTPIAALWLFIEPHWPVRPRRAR
jgi:hypothetical protein